MNILIEKLNMKGTYLCAVLGNDASALAEFYKVLSEILACVHACNASEHNNLAT